MELVTCRRWLRAGAATAALALGWGVSAKEPPAPDKQPPPAALHHSPT